MKKSISPLRNAASFPSLMFLSRNSRKKTKGVAPKKTAPLSDDSVLETVKKEQQESVFRRFYEHGKAFWQQYLNGAFDVSYTHVSSQYYDAKQNDGFLEKHRRVETITYDEIQDMARTIGSNGVVHPSMSEAYKMWSWFEFNRPLRKIYFGVFKVEKFTA